jgi:hypothetical protein
MKNGMRRVVHDSRMTRTENAVARPDVPAAETV